MEKSVRVTKLSCNFAIRFAAFNGRIIFKKGDAQSVLVVDRERQADVFLANVAASGEKSSAEFELIGFRNPSRVHIHRGVASKFGKPIILLILRVGGLCK